MYSLILLSRSCGTVSYSALVTDLLISPESHGCFGDLIDISRPLLFPSLAS